MEKYNDDDCENLPSGGSNLEVQEKYLYMYTYIFLFPSGYFHIIPKSRKWKKNGKRGCLFVRLCHKHLKIVLDKL